MGGVGSGKKKPDPDVAAREWRAWIEQRLCALETQYKSLDERINQHALLMVAEYQRMVELKSRIGRLDALAARDMGDEK